MINLHTIYRLLRAHFGVLHGPAAARPWWPLFSADPACEILVGAVLVQQTRWETVEAALLRLLEANLLSPAALAAADPAALAALIRPAAFHSQKALGLIGIASHVCQGHGGSVAAMLDQPTAALRAELLALPRIGRETCDVIMLYAGGHPVFVVDEYTRRLFERLGLPWTASDMRGAAREDERLSPWRRASYDAMRQAIEDELASGLGGDQASRSGVYAEYHAQINEECVRYCLARPRCDGPPARRVYSRQDGRESYLQRDEGCPLRAVCAYYMNQRDIKEASGEALSERDRDPATR